MKLALLLIALPAAVLSQNAGTQKQEQPLPIKWSECTAPGSCTQKDGLVVLDSNWRWTHEAGTATNCYTGNEWDPNFCPDAATCTANCVIDGVDNADWQSTYGGKTNGDELSLDFVTNGPYSRNVGARDCGLNGALYFVEMQKDGGLSESPTNGAGAAYGTGYCDAQCPHDIKFINGEANMEDWTPSE